MKHDPCRNRGFTLIELMIVVAVIGILAAIAYPSYQAYVIKTRRVVGVGCLGEIAQGMERTMASSLSYTPLGVSTIPPAACIGEVAAFYTFAFNAANTSVSTFQIAATAVGPQAADSNCAVLSIDQRGIKTVTSGSGTPAECWK